MIITTLVQLLDTLFAGKTSCIRRMHALCDSVIVIDEVQTVPNEMLSLFNTAVNFLSGGLRRDYSLVLGDSTVPRTDGAPDDRKYKRYCAV